MSGIRPSLLDLYEGARDNDQWNNAATMQAARLEAVQDLARLLLALGVLTVEEGLREVEKLKKVPTGA